MMDKPPINQHSFGNSTSNQLNLPSNRSTNIGTYNSKLLICSGCDKPIFDQWLLKTMDTFWHEDCLKCQVCGCRLGEVGSSLYFKSKKLLCKVDYLRLFGNKGSCGVCKKQILAFEFVMKARENNYHVDCFACQHCGHRFCVGDRFHLQDDKILCQYDYDNIANGSNQITNQSDANLSRPTNTPNHISSTQ